MECHCRSSEHPVAVQGGWEPKAGEPRILPIIQSTTFKYDNAEHVTRLFDLDAAGFFYTRLANPTTDGFERKIAQMDGGWGPWPPHPARQPPPSPS